MGILHAECVFCKSSSSSSSFSLSLGRGSSSSVESVQYLTIRLFSLETKREKEREIPPVLSSAC